MKLVRRIFVAAAMANGCLRGATSLIAKKWRKAWSQRRKTAKWWGAPKRGLGQPLHVPRRKCAAFDQDGNKQKYGSSLYWTQLSVSFMPTENDTITLGWWMAFGLGNQI